jgi:hypothetical protein
MRLGGRTRRGRGRWSMLAPMPTRDRPRDVITVATDISGRVLVHAKGNPAKIVAVGVAAAAIFVGAAAGYGGYRGIKYLMDKRRAALPPPSPSDS